jgi:thioredoxin 1
LSWIRDFGVHANEKVIVNNNVIELNEASFDREVLNATQPVLVEFWAGWSDPCKAMAPMLESVAEDEAVPVKVARVNVEHHEELTEQYGVRAVPTLLIFNQGGLQDQIVGRTTEQAVRERLERLK